jgi:hypothetical protein
LLALLALLTLGLLALRLHFLLLPLTLSLRLKVGTLA